MPVLTIYGMPAGLGTIRMSKLVSQLRDIVSSELKIPLDDVLVFFPVDLLQEGLGEELVCFVDGMFKIPGKTLDDRKKLTQAVCDHLSAFVRDDNYICEREGEISQLCECTLIQVIVRWLDQDEGSYASCNPHN